MNYRETRDADRRSRRRRNRERTGEQLHRLGGALLLAVVVVWVILLIPTVVDALSAG